MTSPVELHYTARGNGLPVVLIHGFPFNHTIWDAQAAALSEFCRVIAVDLRGHGQSPAPDGVYAMESLAADIAALLDRLNIARAVWIGQSMGGYVTLAALRTLPERVQAVGLIATHPHPDTPEKQLQRAQSAERVLQPGGVEALAQNMLGVLFAPSLNRQSALAQQIYALMLRTPAAGCAGSLRGMAARSDAVPTLRAAHVPAVVIAGAEDQIVPHDVVQGMATLLPGAVLHVMPDAGHMPMVEQPVATTAALHDFLRPLANE